MNNEKLIVTLNEGIKRITFNQPEKRNSVDAEMTEKLFNACANRQRTGRA